VRGLLTPQRVLIGFACLIALIVCCGLAWWQWQRFESASGTFQNLGYVLQWPLFGLFPLFMVWRFRRLARQRRDEPLSEPEPVASAPRPVTTVDAVKPAPVEHFDDPEDAELAAYNRMLADLNARDGR
jgi:DNA-binding transcriptional regulator of glucitol operon